MRLTDVRLLVEDVGQSVRFFQEKMGLKKVLEVEEGVYAEFEAGDARLTMYRRDLMQSVLGGDDGAVGRPGSVVLVFRVQDVDAEFGRLTADGVPALTQPHDQAAWGLRVAHLRDPDGHVIELYRSLE
jgi:lactoylglutathione lyase